MILVLNNPDTYLDKFNNLMPKYLEELDVLRNTPEPLWCFISLLRVRTCGFLIHDRGDRGDSIPIMLAIARGRHHTRPVLLRALLLCAYPFSEALCCSFFLALRLLWVLAFSFPRSIGGETINQRNDNLLDVHFWMELGGGREEGPKGM
jgi:hypothetical protein